VKPGNGPPDPAEQRGRRVVDRELAPRRGHRASSACHRETAQSCEGQRFHNVTNRMPLTGTSGRVGALRGRSPGARTADLRELLQDRRGPSGFERESRASLAYSERVPPKLIANPEKAARQAHILFGVAFPSPDHWYNSVILMRCGLGPSRSASPLTSERCRSCSSNLRFSVRFGAL
jgi:hypothetical protein